jgi:hypothetical protein
MPRSNGCSGAKSLQHQHQRSLPGTRPSATGVLLDPGAQSRRAHRRRCRALVALAGAPRAFVDGATVSLADTEETQAAYPRPSSQQPGLGFPLCRVVGLLCLGSGALPRSAFRQLLFSGNTLPGSPISEPPKTDAEEKRT